VSRWNVGDIPEWEADEDTDRDVEILEEMERKAQPTGKTARQQIEDLQDERRINGSY